MTNTQYTQAQHFLSLHTPSYPLILPNAWDAASAIIFERAGFSAIGTSSAGMAYTLGYPDGGLTRPELLEGVQRIIRSIRLPLTVDVESGYGTSSAEVRSTVSSVIELGAVGINLEDADPGSSTTLRDLKAQCRTLGMLQQLKNHLGIPFVINARTDVFWLNIGSASDRLAAAIDRANAYLEAGADCVFVPGVLSADVIQALSSSIQGPLNILVTPSCPSVPELTKLGVARLSLGSAPARASLGLTRKIAQELLMHGSYSSLFETTIPYGETNSLFHKP